MSYAGNAAGGALSSMFWNPAATAVLPGLNTESSYSLIIPDATVTVKNISPFDPFPPGFPNSSQIGDVAASGGTYGSYQLFQYDPNLFVGIAINGAYGLLTESHTENYLGSVLGRTTRLFTTNANPTVAYRIAPGLIVGVGAQIQYADAALKFATGLPNGPNTTFEGTDVAFGGTAGVLWSPMIGTTIGLGYRSQLTTTLSGDFGVAGVPGTRVSADVDVKLPDIVTLSIQQAVSPFARIMGTVEFTSWSRFDQLKLTATEFRNTLQGPFVPGQIIATIPTNWSDGWFFALGGEYDYNPWLTLRAGAAYELSPVDAPEKRVTGIPDSNRVWLSAGASYKWSESITVDFAYTHIFFQDSGFERSPVGPLSGFTFTGDVTASTDIVSIGLKMSWGGAPAPLK
jgi:long-chain fatty acid transport protein